MCRCPQTAQRAFGHQQLPDGRDADDRRAGRAAAGTSPPTTRTTTATASSPAPSAATTSASSSAAFAATAGRYGRAGYLDHEWAAGPDGVDVRVIRVLGDGTRFDV